MAEKDKQLKLALKHNMEFKPTKEQSKIFLFTEKRKENILIKAYAGTGKTSTIVQAAKLLPQDKSITFLAFNKHIQKELKEKLPEHIRCYTTYGLGMGAIKRKYGDAITLDEFKVDKIIQKKSKSWDLQEEFKSYAKYMTYLNNLKKLVDLCRLTLTLNPNYIPYVAEKYNIRLNKKNDIKRVLKVLDDSTNNRKSFDFVDMVYLPAIDNSIWMFPQDYVFVDEIQDLNRCQLRIVEKIIKKDKLTKKPTGRLIGVGDFFQSIYGFNAADDKSFEWFEKFPNTKTLPLSVSFRCSKNVIKKAQEIVPDINALDDAPDGIVRNGSVLKEAKNGDFILCRTTKPLVNLFFYFLTQNKKAIIKGTDIGIQLIELIGNINDKIELYDFWKNELHKYRDDLIKDGILNPDEHNGYRSLEDKVETLLFLIKLSENIVDLKNKIRLIFTDKIEGICLSTIHKIKGLEANRVFIVRPDLLPLETKKNWEQIQEKNLEYVAITRAKLELIYDDVWKEEDNID